MISGIDVSGYSGNLDYYAIATRCAFVYCKVTDGVNDVDRSLAERCKRLRDVGLGESIGGYHFLRVRHAMRQDADEQCKQHLDARAKAGCTLPSMFDVEMDSLSGGQNGALAKALLDPRTSPLFKQTVIDEVRAACELYWDTHERYLGGALPFYSSPGEMQTLGTWQIPRIINYPLALAKYICAPGSVPSAIPTAGPSLPAPFTSWALWQYAGNVPEYGGSVDRLLFNGTIEELRALQ